MDNDTGEPKTFYTYRRGLHINATDKLLSLIHSLNTHLTIIRSHGKEHLGYRDEECFAEVSLPMMTFTEGEDDFEIVKCNRCV